MKVMSPPFVFFDKIYYCIYSVFKLFLVDLIVIIEKTGRRLQF